MRKDYLKVPKQRRPSRNQKTKAIKKQLQYIKRSLSQIEQLKELGADLGSLNKRQYKMLLVVTEVYRQQHWLAEHKKQSISDRIVSLSQPHQDPIVRGKAGKPVEFGAKLSASYFERYVFLERLSWDKFNESGDFKAPIEAYYKFTGSNSELFMLTAFMGQERTELGVEKEVLESADYFYGDPQQTSVKKKRSRL